MKNSYPGHRARSIAVNVLLWGIALSYGFADWSIYHTGILLHGGKWQMYLTGGIQAPFQYRIGSWVIVYWLDRWFHMQPYNALTLIDVVCAVLALWLVLRFTENTYLSKLPPKQLLSIFAVLFFAEYYLVWGHWFQSPETLPSILFVAASMALVSGKIVRNRGFACVLLIFFGALQGFFRADVAVVMHSGFLLTAIFSKRISLPLGRFRQAIVSLLAAIAAGCVQMYLMFVRFPHAQYGPEGVIQIAANLRPGMWLTMLLTFFPYFALLVLVIRKRFVPSGTQSMLLVASVLYLILWAIAGQVDETRIFLPFAFALLPATVAALTDSFARDDLDRGTETH